MVLVPGPMMIEQGRRPAAGFLLEKVQVDWGLAWVWKLETQQD